MTVNRSVTCPACHRPGAHVTVGETRSAQSDAPTREYVTRFECPNGCEPEFATVPLR